MSHGLSIFGAIGRFRWRRGGASTLKGKSRETGPGCRVDRQITCGIAALAPYAKSFKLKHSSLKDIAEPSKMRSGADSEDGRA
jgi:hypothetical protein